VAVTIASTHCTYPRRDGQAELAWVAGYVGRQFTCPKAVTHPSTNRAQCTVTVLIETNALLLHQTATYIKLPKYLELAHFFHLLSININFQLIISHSVCNGVKRGIWSEVFVAGCPSWHQSAAIVCWSSSFLHPSRLLNKARGATHCTLALRHKKPTQNDGNEYD